jgi:hypothetical protein
MILDKILTKRDLIQPYQIPMTGSIHQANLSKKIYVIIIFINYFNNKDIYRKLFSFLLN